ncbi:MAG TPA: PAS domain-containing sensor histidine kinase [Candidatus Acidoferrales bacterium]|nr:PAS domain-containing sensor histidine kinase [Candidatus Acidoferrales bacterium]
MNAPIAHNPDVPDTVAARTAELFKEQQQSLIRHTDRMCSWLMIFQWFFAIGLAFWLSPRTWSGINSQVHPHIWVAIFLGGVITALPVYLARTQSGKAFTRHIVAGAQMLMSALLIHLTGGRIETHFHVFGSLAILAFYRDWRVLVTATVVIAADHLVRGIFWPQSVFGVLYAPLWRPFEHAGWVLFEVTFLIIAIQKSLSEMQLVAERQAKLEAVKESIERTVTERTAELSRENRKHRELQALYRSLVEQLPAGIFRKDTSGRYEFVNSWFCRLRDKAPSQIIGKTPEELAQMETGEPMIQLLRQGVDHHQEIMQTGKTIEVLEEYRGANGKTQHLHVVKSPVFGADGNIVGSQGVLMDITGRKQAETALAYEKYLLNALLTNSDDKIYFKDAASKFIRCSTSMAKNFNVAKPEDLIGKRDCDFFSDEHAGLALEDEQKIMQTGVPVIGKVEKETWPNGRVTWAITTKMPLYDENGKIAGTFGVSKDLTAIKETEAELAETHKRLLDTSRQAGMAEVATSVLHNVGNVLNSVNVSTSLIAEKIQKSKVSSVVKVVDLMRAHPNDLGNFFANDPKGKQVPEYLAKLAEHLAQEQQELLKEIGSLINNVVHIKEIVAMQQGYAKAAGIVESLKASDLVEDAIRMNSGAVDRHNIKIIRDFGQVPVLATDKHKVLQVLVNLIRNSKYACDDSERTDKQITLRLRNGDGRVKISVIDNGIGIAPENLTRIFMHGFTTRKEGHGFGLHSGAIAAKELGGTLTAHSEGIGRGATFTLDLPAQQNNSHEHKS